MRPKAENPTLFYDGECAFCQRSLCLLQRWDADKRLNYAPLQSNLAKKLGIGSPPFDSLIYYRPKAAKATFKYSSATLAALRDIGGWPSLLGYAGWVVPRPLRDAIYRLIASQRHRLGKSSCDTGLSK